MKLIGTVSMHTDHDYYGFPIETSAVNLYVNTDAVTSEQLQILRRTQEKKLHSMAKSMPHSFWQKELK